MAAHIGVGLASEPGGTLVITSMSPKGTAATSGMLRANDQLIKVDGVAVQSPQHAQQLLHGEANTIVKVKVRRRTQQGLVNLDVSLVREVGDEHNLTQNIKVSRVHTCRRTRQVPRRSGKKSSTDKPDSTNHR